MKYKKSEIGYVAGIFDIHGSMKIIVPDNDDLNASSLYVWITSKHANLMKFLRLFDAWVGRVSCGQFRAKWKDAQAAQFLKLIFPHLVIQRDLAEVGLEFWKCKSTQVDPKEYVLPLQVRLRLLKKDDSDE